MPFRRVDIFHILLCIRLTATVLTAASVYGFSICEKLLKFLALDLYLACDPSD